MNQAIQLLVQYLKPLRLWVVCLAVLIITGIGLQLINPLIIRYFIDTAVAGEDTRPLLLAALAFLGISIVAQIIGIAAVYVGEDVGWRATNRLRADLTRHCLQLDMSFHNAHTPGEMIERIDGDILALANFFSRFVIRILGNVLLLVGVLLVVAFVDWRISLVLLAYIVLGIAAMLYLGRIGVPHWQATRQAGAELFGFLEEQLSGTEDVRSSNAVNYVLHHLLKFNQALSEKVLKSVTAANLIVMAWVGLYVVGQTVTFLLGYTLLGAGLITIGSVYLVIYYTYFVFGRLSEITAQIQDLQQAAGSLKRVAELYAVESQIKSEPHPTVLPPGPLAVYFDNVTFGYTEQEPVLQNISFCLPAGRTLGLLGRTGSGKTTITRLLFRLYDPIQGTIRLGVEDHYAQPETYDLRQFTLSEVHQRISLVTQNVQLFTASVRDNVTLFDKRIPDTQIRQVMADLGLSDWYEKLPAGLDTLVGTGGSNLSAGEAQLLAFVRIFLRNPNVVILDEASSRLDPATEKRIEHAIDKLLENRTGIIVAHRLSTVHRADHILIIEDGQIQEFGDYDVLVQDSTSRFYNLLQAGLEEALA
ncbi:putative ABC transporter ATP-binding protein [Thermoflexales bacterium]|nr:putative ABC transporter ATP-binding protein [Thermoflexales bacterium]